ncbi:MAG: hypothetical protein IPH63_09265 [Flavobacteriales bacterium]|nr:hypothetical protein [Flavobacteriales bacterium]
MLFHSFSVFASACCWVPSALLGGRGQGFGSGRVDPRALCTGTRGCGTPDRGEQEQLVQDRVREAMDLNAQLAAETERNRGLQEKLDNQHADLEKAQARMTTEFEVIATKLLTARGKELTEQQNEKLGTILRPLHDKLKDFEEQVRKAYETEGKGVTC